LALAVAAYERKINPNVLIVFGGPDLASRENLDDITSPYTMGLFDDFFYQIQGTCRSCRPIVGALFPARFAMRGKAISPRLSVIL